MFLPRRLRLGTGAYTLAMVAGKYVLYFKKRMVAPDMTREWN